MQKSSGRLLALLGLLQARSVAVGLRAVTGVKGVEETSVRALAKPCSRIAFSGRSMPYGMRCKPDPRTPDFRRLEHACQDHCPSVSRGGSRSDQSHRRRR